MVRVSVRVVLRVEGKDIVMFRLWVRLRIRVMTRVRLRIRVMTRVGLRPAGLAGLLPPSGSDPVHVCV